MTDRINYFFHPKSIAIIGASDKTYSWGNWIGGNLIKYKERGNIHIVNPKHTTVLGEPTYKTIAEIPEDIDLGVVIVPAKQVVETLEQCALKNAKVALIISAGFDETTEGQEMALGLKRVVKEYGIRLQGPNCAGFYNNSVPINASPYPPEYLKESPVALITQSGYVGNSLSIWGAARHLHIGKYISVGNEADLTVTDYVEYFSKDPTTQVIMLYIEGIKDGPRFKQVIEQVAPQKPIVVWKASETGAVKRAALSHTGHLTGSQEVFKGLMKQLGVIQLRRVEYGLLVCYAFLRYPLLRGNRLAVMMVGAGWGIILVDSLTNAGFEVPEFSDDLKQQLRKYLPSYRVSVKNPVDYGAADTMDFSILTKITKAVFESGEVDGFVIANVGDMAPFEENAAVLESQIAISLLRIQRKSDKPIYLFTPLTELESNSIPIIKKKQNIYHTMDALIETLQAQFSHYRWKNR